MQGRAELRRILLVEDSENDLEMTLEALHEYRLANQIDVVRDGAEALDYLFCRGNYASRPGIAPVVAVIDIKLPKVNGIEVLREIRANAQLRRLPVVMLTSSREEPDLRDCYNSGCNAYVVKPVDFQSFSEALKVVGCFWAVLNEIPAKTEDA
jgi:CheY-like chemotaxis protein